MELYGYLRGIDHLHHSASVGQELRNVDCDEDYYGVVLGRTCEYHVGDCKRYLEGWEGEEFRDVALHLRIACGA